MPTEINKWFPTFYQLETYKKVYSTEILKPAVNCQLSSSQLLGVIPSKKEKGIS
jgi:hypothetical protein